MVNQSVRTDVERLSAKITDIDALSQEGFSEISAAAKLALLALEHPDGYRHSENIAQALRAIWGKAEDIQNCINCEAEAIGCNFVDKSFHRRYDALRAARE